MKHAPTSFGLIPFLALLAASTSLQVAGIGQVPAVPPVEIAPAADEAARLLTLADGKVLRVRARPTDTGWEIQEQRNQWTRLPEAMVVRAVLERDALTDAKRLEAQIGSVPRAEQNSKRVGLADWMLRQGLSTEALTQLDRVLVSDPDQTQALSVLTRIAPELRIGAIDSAMASEEPTLSVLRAAANATPSLREIAIQRIASGASGDELRTELRAQLVSHSPRLRALSALALRRIFPGQNLRVDEVKELINRSVLDGADEVRVEAARALRDVRDPAVAGPALKALNSVNPRLRENSIQALGVMAYPSTVQPLMTHLSRVNSAIQSGRPSSSSSGSIYIGTQTAYVQDFDVEVANGSAIADPQINVLVEGSVLDARVLGSYVVSYASEARLVRSALIDLTGMNHGSSNRAWLAWWEANKAQWNNSPVTPSAGTTSAPAPAKK